mgnify:CR=1 FL=1
METLFATYKNSKDLLLVLENEDLSRYEYFYLVSSTEEIFEKDWYISTANQSTSFINQNISLNQANGLIGFHESVRPYIYKVIQSNDPALGRIVENFSIVEIQNYLQRKTIEKCLFILGVHSTIHNQRKMLYDWVNENYITFEQFNILLDHQISFEIGISKQ